MADHKVHVSRSKLFRAKEIACRMIEGTLADQYGKLHDYIAELRRTNPSSTIQIQGDRVDNNRLKRLYICLGACKKSFVENCRPLIGMDGCHLKGSIGGQLLTAIGVDGNNSMFPIAYALVESENKASWCWFLELLKADVGIVNTFGWTFMSDKQKGLVPALELLCPNSEHRFCVRHLYANFKGDDNKGLLLKDKLYRCAKATTMAQFGDGMLDMMNTDEKAFKWLSKRPPSQWSKSHFRTWPKSDMLLNNLCESFNALILDARDKPILTMLEKIRLTLMKRMHVNFSKMSKQTGLLCPKIQEILEKTKDEASHCTADWAGSPRFQVQGPGGTFVCDLEAMTCACRRWDLTGIPCMHGVAAMRNGGLEPEQFVNIYYHRETYLRCYGNFIEPLNGPHLWKKTGLPAVLPPIYSAQVGRKKKKRRLGIQDEKEGNATKLGKKHQNSLKCGKCGKSGHNQRSCKAEGASTSASKSKGKAGRPRKAKPSGATTAASSGGVASSGAAAVSATGNSKLSVKRKKYTNVAYMGNNGSSQLNIPSQSSQVQSTTTSQTKEKSAHKYNEALKKRHGHGI